MPLDIETREQLLSSVRKFVGERLVPLALSGVGMQVLEKRHVPGGARTFRWQVTDYQPPVSWGFRGSGSPVNAIARMRFTPLAQGAATMVRFEIDFEARGLGKLIAPLARRGARNEIPRDLQQLKAQLESR